MHLAAIRERWGQAIQSERGKRIGKWLRITLLVGIVAHLIYQLGSIGWPELWASRPRSAGYFLLLPLGYLLLPATEAFIFGKLWGVRRRDALLASLKKRTLNSDVLNYSGEVQFYLWARKEARPASVGVLKSIKDNLIVSSLASVISTVLVVGAFIAGGQVDLGPYAGTVTVWHVAGGAVLVALAATAAVRFRTVLFSLPGRMLAGLLAIHTSRYILGWVLLVLQWWFVLPNEPFRTWAVLLTAIVLVDRIPLLPSKDLVLAGVGIGLSGPLNVPAAAIAGLLLVRTAFNKALNLSIYAGSALRKRRAEPSPRPEEPVHAEAVSDETPLAHAA